ncbi:hypothetical protein K493DRAFT_84085 [Basidiobolus meristosporus CBS 931.73]|uniref:Uncharacterized protein n=1 Tax=Basidiobolus meristosporus CBS 931.73 TaxID=1314790 RepID=A0A1Y1YWK2_9FUNG|nr:hypothetical protein K493DRAFT_84085 [Basidiobolus meristosporus CBS 931.73]|eukprot:ORY02329.1 hypothetical protein K493DRAFT_84085 [Basidiobolus meristosporus CBS 931.73]
MPILLGSALPATASWAKLVTNKSKLATVKTPLLSLDQFPPPPATARPKAKVISLSKKSQPEQKSRASSVDGDTDNKKSKGPEISEKQPTLPESKPTSGVNTPALSNSPESITQEASNQTKVDENETTHQKVEPTKSPEVKVEEVNGQKEDSEPTQPSEQSVIDEERLHQEVMAELERERSAFYQQSRANVSLPPGLAFPFSPMPLSTNTYKGGFDPFGSDPNSESRGQDSLLSSMQSMHLQNSLGAQSGAGFNRPFNSFTIDDFSQKQNLESKPVQNARPKLYSRFGFALNEDDDFGPAQSMNSQPSGLFDPFGRNAIGHGPEQNSARAIASYSEPWLRWPIQGRVTSKSPVPQG